MDLSSDLKEIVQMSAIETELEAFQLFSASYTEVLAGIGADTDINVYYLTEAQQQDWWDNAINPALQGMMEDVLGDELATAQQIAIRAIAIYIANH